MGDPGKTGGLAARSSPSSDGTGGETLALWRASHSRCGLTAPPLRGPPGYSKGSPDAGPQELKSWRRAFYLLARPARRLPGFWGGVARGGTPGPPSAAESYREGLNTIPCWAFRWSHTRRSAGGSSRCRPHPTKKKGNPPRRPRPFNGPGATRPVRPENFRRMRGHRNP